MFRFVDDRWRFPWRDSLTISHLVLGVLTIFYCVNVFVAAEACYVLPCYEGPGLQALWKVNKGVTFTGKSSGWFALAHSALGFFLFCPRGKAVLEEAHFVAGVFSGGTFCAALLMLNMTWVWGAEWNLLGDMTRLREDNIIFEESGRHMSVNLPLVDTFRRLFYLSLAMCAVQTFILVQLVVARKLFAGYFRLEGGTSGETTPLQIESPAIVT